MAERYISARRQIDWITVSIYFSLLIIGWLMLYATVYTEQNASSFLDLSTMMGKQSLWVLISILVFFCCLIIDWKVWFTFSYPIYFISLLLLLLVLFIGLEVKGARSWFSVAGLSFQPAEFAKFGCCLALAAVLSFHKSDLKRRGTIFVCAGIIITPAVLILLQPDAGSALVFSSFLILLYREGLSPAFYLVFGLFGAVFIASLIFDPKIVLFGLCAMGLSILLFNMPRKTYWLIGGLVGICISGYVFTLGFGNYAIIFLAIVTISLIGYLWIKQKTQWGLLLIPTILFLSAISYGTNYAFNNFLEPHQQERIKVWLKPHECDPRGSLYNIIQSKLAIGSGGFAGKGFLKGDLTKLNYVPEQTTDFIFSTVGEEQGFIGSAAVIILFLLLIFRITQIAERANSQFIRHYAYGVGGLIFIHFFVNIGMTMGLMPVIGIPLPFLSKGGSALLVFSLMLGILIKMDLSRHRELSR